MRRTRKTAYIALVLTVFSIGFALFRHYHYALSFYPPQGNDSWTIEARLFFQAGNGASKARFNLPKDNKNFTIIDEQFVTQNYSTSIVEDEKNDNRVAVFENKKASGAQVILYRVTVELDKTLQAQNAEGEIQPVQNILPPKTAIKRPAIAAINRGLLDKAVLNLIAHVRENSKTNREVLTTAIAELRNKDSEYAQAVYAQLEQGVSSYSLLEYVLYKAQIPYNKTHGFNINKDNKSYPFREWIDAYLDGAWVQIGADGALNDNEDPEQFRWWNGEQSILEVQGGTHADISIYYKENLASQTAKEIEKGAAQNLEWLKFPFSSLSITTQKALEVLLLMPIGALLVSIGRQMIGVETYGTFMPVLLAVAFRDITPTWSLIMFGCIISIGLIARVAIDNLQLLMIPKLSVIMTAIIMGIAAFSLIAKQINVTATISIGLLPIVILSMLIERIIVNWDEYGYRNTINSVLGSLFITSTCYMVLNQNFVSHLMFNFPELILVILSAILLVGRYRGYKLLELIRFKYFLKGNQLEDN